MASAGAFPGRGIPSRSRLTAKHFQQRSFCREMSRKLWLAGMLFCAGAWGQAPEREAPMPRRSGQGGTPASLRVLVIYPEGSFPESQARRWEQGLLAHFKIEYGAAAFGWPAVRLERMIEAMFDGGQSARMEGAAPGAALRPGPAGTTLGQLFADGHLVGIVLKQSGGDTPCPPSPCGCDTPGAYQSCSCVLLRYKGMPEYCMCYLCYKAVTLSDLRLAADRTLVIVVAGPRDPVESLAQAALREIPQLGPPTAGLTIKVKSSRP